MDDVSLPEVNLWGDQPTCELVRQLIETGGFFFLNKEQRGDFKNIERVSIVAAMGEPGMRDAVCLSLGFVRCKQE